MTKLEALEIAALVAEVFSGPQMSKLGLEFYASMLLDLEAHVVRDAIARLSATAAVNPRHKQGDHWRPSPSDIRATVADMTHGARRQGGEAWGDVCEAIRRVGRYHEPEFADPVVAECVKQFGWLTLCDSTNDTADRARFVELYDKLATQERANVVAGKAIPKPTQSGLVLPPAQSWTPRLKEAPKPERSGLARVENVVPLARKAGR